VAIEYFGVPTVEWTRCFLNTGSQVTPILQDIQALDVVWQRDETCAFLLRSAVVIPGNSSDDSYSADDDSASSITESGQHD
jgi:hypothetical protein